MKNLNFHIDPLSVAQTDNKYMRERGTVFLKQDITLFCLATNHRGTIHWRFQGDIIQPSSHYIFSQDRLSLTVKSVNIGDNDFKLWSPFLRQKQFFQQNDSYRCFQHPYEKREACWGKFLTQLWRNRAFSKCLDRRLHFLSECLCNAGSSATGTTSY